MNYNLTPKQRDLIKDIVEEVRAGNLEGEFNVTWLPNGTAYFAGDYWGKKVFGDMSRINLKALEKEELLEVVDMGSGYKCAPKEFAFQAIDSDFGASIVPSTATSGVAVQVNDVVLVQLLEGYFDLDELRELCFKVGVKYENVGGGTLFLKCQNLVSYMVRRGRLMTLIVTAVKERPEVDWSSLH